MGAAPGTFLSKLSSVPSSPLSVSYDSRGQGPRVGCLESSLFLFMPHPAAPMRAWGEEVDTKWIQVKMQSWSTRGQLDLTALNSYHLCLVVWNQFWAD